jgi:hypothetical protein
MHTFIGADPGFAVLNPTAVQTTRAARIVDCGTREEVPMAICVAYIHMRRCISTRFIMVHRMRQERNSSNAARISQLIIS